MVYEIVWTPKAMESFVENMEYLQNKWTQKEVDQFISIVEKKISLLSSHPEIGSPRNKIRLNIRQTVLHKRVLLLYRVKPKFKILELLLFWNTYKHPAKLKINNLL